MCVPPTGDLAHNPGMCPDWELNQRPFGLQAGTQPTEPHQPGQCFQFFYLCLCVKSVTLESNNDIHMQNNTLEYDNQFC